MEGLDIVFFVCAISFILVMGLLVALYVPRNKDKKTLNEYLSENKYLYTPPPPRPTHTTQGLKVVNYKIT